LLMNQKVDTVASSCISAHFMCQPCHCTRFIVTNAKWIWTSSAGGTSVPVPPDVTAGFRLDFAAPYGKIPVSANIIIAADNVYTLYINGKEIGQGNHLRVRQNYCVDLKPDCNNVFAVAVLDEPVAGGVVLQHLYRGHLL
jgi:hypothetical protein